MAESKLSPSPQSFPASCQGCSHPAVGNQGNIAQIMLDWLPKAFQLVAMPVGHMSCGFLLKGLHAQSFSFSPSGMVETPATLSVLAWPG